MTSEAVYYGAKLATDVAIIAASLKATIDGVARIITGAGTIGGALAEEGATLGLATGPAILVAASGVVSIALGVAEIGAGVATMVSTFKNAKDDMHNFKLAASKGEGNDNKIKINEKQKDHIFRDSDGHLVNDTLANRQKLENVANNNNNYLGKDKYGNDWYAQTNADGTQTWVKVRNGSIENGGVNQTPNTYNPQTGLSSPIKP